MAALLTVETPSHMDGNQEILHLKGMVVRLAVLAQARRCAISYLETTYRNTTKLISFVIGCRSREEERHERLSCLLVG